MSIFNSLGSNYDFNFALKSLFTFGNSSKDLENLLEEKYKGKVTLVYKGRETIELALKTLNLPKNSFVAINGFTCFAVYDVIKKAGLRVEYLDIDRGELNFSAETLQKAIDKNQNIKVVIVQNTLGYPSQIEGISKICKQNNIHLIEDLAHSVGTVYEKGEEAGRVADFVCLSFSQDKIIDGISGGALISRTIPEVEFNPISLKQQIVDKFYPMFTFVIRKTYSVFIGKLLHFILKKLNLLSKPMSNINGFHSLPSWYAKLSSEQFTKLDSNLNHRKTIASIYSKLINPKILSPKIIDKVHLSSNLRFPIFIEDRENLIEYLKNKGIYVSDIWYDAPIAPKKYLTQTDYNHQCPNSELASISILNLPTHINVSKKDAENISNLVNQWLKSK